ncbi:glycoside hydrolase family 16 protein [Coralloluteibacterium thermophilus]|uniref:Family 16 glycosylhydrolase n=1 Tax=Coralloluteibacterium thermophilum TaxID=2707049 RepID=A0ABV9NKT2_9GAMM
MDRARLFALGTACLGAVALALSPTAHAQNLVWEENFDGPGIDGGTWTYDVGTGCQIGLCGWGNAELQYYTSRPENARIENGRLVIEARRETFEGSPFTSARLKTEGRLHFKYGTLEARIRTPEVGNGLWPAYWMLGVVGVWPERGEIDIMEAGSAAAIAEGMANRRIGGAVHWDYNGHKADYSRDYDSPTDLHTDFRVYRMTWDPEFIRMYIDDVEYFAFDISDPDGASVHEFHQQHYLLLNVAVGGTYTGILSPDGITAPLPGRMEVDYIRLYQDHPESELYIGGDAAIPAGRFGVFTEQPGLAGSLDFGADANLYLWNNLTPIDATPYEGGNVMAFRANAGEWFGLGIIGDVRNMSAYAGGALRFHMRTTTPATFKIGINTSFGDSWVDFVDGGPNYGLVRDGNWHEVTIPFDAFYDLDLHAVRQMFMVVADPHGAPVEFAIDNVYYESP